MNLQNVLLSEKTKRNLLSIGYKELTDIQKKVIPFVMEGKDVVAQSSTGTGKTAAFLIPSVENIESDSNFAKMIILVPTRELAMQVSEEAKRLSSHKNLRILSVFGGSPMFPQLKALKKGVDIIVGTPGRMIDHIFQKKTIKTDDLKYLVIDEVDEMIDKGFLLDIEKIVKRLPVEKQTMVFSATMPDRVNYFVKKYLIEPVRLEGKDEKKDEGNIEHYYLDTNRKINKNKILSDLFKKNFSESSIVFANTKRKVEQIYKDLSGENMKVDYIHSGLSQSRRIRVFNKFKEGKILCLIATDVAARGLDVKNLAFVINYDFPQTNEFYIHRVGRTGRAGATGKALTFLSSFKEKKQLLFISKDKNFKLEEFI
jgi:ATP-dependent RNA helicase DeaD